MKTAIFAGAAVLALATGVAGAADLPFKGPPVYAPAFNWTGCYIGGNLGAAWSQSDWNDKLFGLNWGDTTSDTKFIGGAQIGCNYQFNNPGFMLGFEGDFDWVGTKDGGVRTAVTPAGSPLPGDVISLNAHDMRIATLAARFGYGVDRVLFYGKFGGGWVANNGLSVVDQTTGAAFVANIDNNRPNGWMAGAGIEYAFTNCWTVKAEYNYIQLPGRAFLIPGVVVPSLAFDTITTSHNVQMVKFGINYLFDGGPLAGRY